MIKDLERSPLVAPSLLEKADEFVNDSLKVLKPGDEIVSATRHIARLKSHGIWGFPSDRDIALLAELSQETDPLKVDCQSICVGAYAAFVSMKNRYNANYIVDPGAASGRETASSDGFAGDDVIVTADAPMLLGVNEFGFEKVFVVTTEVQSILQRRGIHHTGKSSVFVYPLSSVEHQLLFMAERQPSSVGEFRFPAKPIEIPLTDLSDYLVLEQTMLPGDYVIVWDPLRTTLIASELFDEVPGSEFSLPLSLFVSEENRFGWEHMDAFLRLFIAELNHIKANPQRGLSLLLLDEPFRRSLIRGAALPRRS